MAAEARPSAIQARNSHVNNYDNVSIVFIKEGVKRVDSDFWRIQQVAVHAWIAASA